MRWFKQNIAFASVGFGVFLYIHCLSRHWTYRLYWSRPLGGFGWDRHPKSNEALAKSGIVLHGG